MSVVEFIYGQPYVLAVLNSLFCFGCGIVVGATYVWRNHR